MNSGKRLQAKNHLCHPLRKTIVVLFLSLAVLFSLLVQVSSAGVNQWTSNGPEDGIIQSIALSPTYATDQTVFAGTNGGGVYKSTDGASLWTQNISGITNYDIRSVAVSSSYATDSTVFAGSYGGGVYKSVDAGSTWTVSGLDGQNVKTVALSPDFATDGTAFAGTNGGGVYRTVDGGAGWTQIDMTGMDVQSIAVSPTFASDNTVFAGTNGDGIYRSTNGGATWVLMDMVGKSIESVAVSPNYAADGTVFVGADSSGVYKSTNRGSSWTSIDLNGKKIQSVAVSPNYASDQTLFVGSNGNGVYRSTNSGNSWQQVNEGIAITRVYTDAISPNYGADRTVYAGTNGGGVYKTTNSGANWLQVNRGITNNDIRSVAISPDFVSDSTLFAGADRAGLYRSVDGGSTWTLIDLVNKKIRAVAVSPNYVADGTVFVGTDGNGMYKSTDRGLTWNLMDMTSQKILSVAISPAYASDNTIFAGTGGNGVYRSTNGGVTWAQVDMSGQDVLSVAVSPDYAVDSTLFAGTKNNGIYRTTNRGVSWSQVGLSGKEVQSVAISPTYAADRVVIAGANGSGLYKSADAGATWVSKDLIGLDVQSVAISPNFASDNVILAGTNGNGAYRSADGGENWSQFNSGLYNVYIRSFVVSPGYALDNTVFAGTWGGGVFAHTLDEVDPVTTLATDPLTADGENSWFKSVPSVTLMHSEPGTTYYQWDSTSTVGWTPYTTAIDALEGQHTLYYYSEDLGGNAEFPRSQAFKVDTGAPMIPLLSGSAGGADRVELSWEPVADSYSGVAGYRVFEADTGAQIAETVSTSYAVTGLTAATTYRYYVKAFDNAGNLTGVSNTVTVITPSSGADSSPPSVPALVGFAPSTTQIGLYWLTATDDVGVAGYRVYDAGTDSELVSMPSTSHLISGLGAGVTYSYYVKAYDAAGNLSAASNTVTIDPGRDGVTPASGGGSACEVTPEPDVTLTFTSIVADGASSVSKQDVPVAAPPAGYVFRGRQYEIQTTASYSGPIRVAIRYNPADIPGGGDSLKLFHYEGGQWVDVTSYVDVANSVIVGQTASLSPFILGDPGEPVTGRDSALPLAAGVVIASLGLLLLLPIRTSRP